MNSKHLLLMAPLLLGAFATAPAQTLGAEDSPVVQTTPAETRAVTLDITGMT